jgi:hypothetical protein
LLSWGARWSGNPAGAAAHINGAPTGGYCFHQIAATRRKQAMYNQVNHNSTMPALFTASIMFTAIWYMIHVFGA